MHAVLSGTSYPIAGDAWPKRPPCRASMRISRLSARSRLPSTEIRGHTVTASSSFLKIGEAVHMEDLHAARNVMASGIFL
jgi:hypothetical protein